MAPPPAIAVPLPSPCPSPRGRGEGKPWGRMGGVAGRGHPETQLGSIRCRASNNVGRRAGSGPEPGGGVCPGGRGGQLHGGGGRAGGAEVDGQPGGGAAGGVARRAAAPAHHPPARVDPGWPALPGGGARAAHAAAGGDRRGVGADLRGARDGAPQLRAGHGGRAGVGSAGRVRAAAPARPDRAGGDQPPGQPRRGGHRPGPARGQARRLHAGGAQGDGRRSWGCTPRPPTSNAGACRAG